jgi:hypothetical protein
MLIRTDLIPVYKKERIFGFTFFARLWYGETFFQTFIFTWYDLDERRRHFRRIKYFIQFRVGYVFFSVLVFLLLDSEFITAEIYKKGIQLGLWFFYGVGSILHHTNRHPDYH